MLNFNPKQDKIICYINAQNTTYELFSIYFITFVTSFVVFIQYFIWPVPELLEGIHPLLLPVLYTLSILVSAYFLYKLIRVFLRIEKVRSWFLYIAQIFASPLIILAWFLYVFNIINTTFVDKILIFDLKNIVNYVLAIYLTFISIRFFFKLSKTKFFEPTEAKHVKIKPIFILSISLITLIIYFYTLRINNIGVAYSKSFLVANFLFDFSIYLGSKKIILNLAKKD